jgi:hypothetical protein
MNTTCFNAVVTLPLYKNGFHPYRIENDYSPVSYLARAAIRPPLRLRAPIEHEVDLVFSRKDAEGL